MSTKNISEDINTSSSYITQRRAEQYWRSIQSGRDAACAYLLNEFRSSGNGAESAAQIIRSRCHPSDYQDAIAEFNLVLGLNYQASLVQNGPELHIKVVRRI